MFRGITLITLLSFTACFGCHRKPSSRKADDTLVFLIESSPTSLDPRIGIDAQSEHIYALIFDGLVVRDASYRFGPGLAESWDQPDPLTLVFHLRPNIHFQDGRHTDYSQGGKLRLGIERDSS